eukprot:PhF_6_TR42745/c0_g1_i1/m.64612
MFKFAVFLISLVSWCVQLSQAAEESHLSYAYTTKPCVNVTTTFPLSTLTDDTLSTIQSMVATELGLDDENATEPVVNVTATLGKNNNAMFVISYSNYNLVGPVFTRILNDAVNNATKLFPTKLNITTVASTVDRVTVAIPVTSDSGDKEEESSGSSQVNTAAGIVIGIVTGVALLVALVMMRKGPAVVLDVDGGDDMMVSSPH